MSLAPISQMECTLDRTQDEDLRKALAAQKDADAKALDAMADLLSILREECIELGLEISVAQIDRIIKEKSVASRESLVALFNDFNNRIQDELGVAIFFKLDSTDRRKYEQPLERWEKVLQRFEGAAFDVEEASKSLALERYTSCVFHLMRVTECSVLELQGFLDKPDIKAHFGSVLSKLEHLHTKTRFEDLPENLKP